MKPSEPRQGQAVFIGGITRRIFAAIALAGLPLSLTSPGATVSMACVALFGISLLLRGDKLDPDIRRAFNCMLPCYLLLVVADLLNGGGARNVETAFNYLPLLTLVPYAHAVRRLGIARNHLVIALCATILAAVAMSAYQGWLLGEARPGGINLNPIPMGFVVALWIATLLSIALEEEAFRLRRLMVATAGFIPVILTGSKIAIAALIAGCLAVGLLWARRTGRWKEALAASAVAVGAVVAGVYFIIYDRVIYMAEEIVALWSNGHSDGGSIGLRLDIAIAGLKAFLENPILGYGFAERMENTFLHMPQDWNRNLIIGHIHNDYITHMVSYGVFGIVFILLYYFFNYRIFLSLSAPELQRAGIAILLMLLLYMAAEIAFNMDPISGALTVAFGMFLALGGSPAIKGGTTATVS